MDNSQTPQMQPMGGMPPAPMMPPTPSMQPDGSLNNAQQAAGVPVGQPGGQYGTAPNGMPMVQQVQVMPEKKKDIAGLVKTIVIIVLSLIAVTFIGLFIWMFTQYNEVQTDVEGKINEKVAEAKYEQKEADIAQFVEDEKYPYKTFSGPVDYGQLTFEYPKTWSVYVENAATGGGEFNAYFNPIQVNAVSEDTINALRVIIKNESFDAVSETYKRDLESKDAKLSMESVTIGRDKNITANRYTGTIPGTELSGFFVTFKIRDKTAILRTDSVLFQEEFDKLLNTVTFNE